MTMSLDTTTGLKSLSENQVMIADMIRIFGGEEQIRPLFIREWDEEPAFSRGNA